MNGTHYVAYNEPMKNLVVGARDGVFATAAALAAVQILGKAQTFKRLAKWSIIPTSFCMIGVLTDTGAVFQADRGIAEFSIRESLKSLAKWSIFSGVMIGLGMLLPERAGPIVGLFGFITPLSLVCTVGCTVYWSIPGARPIMEINQI